MPTPIRHPVAAPVLLMALVALALNGCLPGKSRDELTRWSHKRHIKEDQEMFSECDLCHKTEKAGGKVRAKHDTCSDCHDIEMDEPGKDCLYCHTPPKGVTVPEDEEKLKDLLKKISAKLESQKASETSEGGWDHSRTHGKVECTLCHGNVLEDKYESPHEFHRRHVVRDGCTLCHEKDLRTVPPQNHAEPQAWRLGHGIASHTGQVPDCTVCHQQPSFCDDCHRTEKPRDHTALFRNRGHGFAAETDRRSCAVCHQPDFCDACHQQNEPQSHTAAFKSRGHCTSCHEQSTERGSRCKVCHTLDTGTHSELRVIGRPEDGLTLHALPQGFGSNLSQDCTVCHDFTIPPPSRRP